MEDGLLAVSLTARVARLVGGPEAWISHGTAHPGEDFNVSLGSGCVDPLQRSPPPPQMLNKELLEEVFGFSSTCERTLAHPGSSPSSFDLPLSIVGVGVGGLGGLGG